MTVSSGGSTQAGWETIGISLLIRLIKLLPHVPNHSPKATAGESGIVFDLFQIALAQCKCLQEKQVIWLIVILGSKLRIVQLSQVDRFDRIELLLALFPVERVGYRISQRI